MNHTVFSYNRRWILFKVSIFDRDNIKPKTGYLKMLNVSNIVFTKNRPLQLDAYLTSLYCQFPEDLLQTYIVYKKECFHAEYIYLFQKFPKCIVIEEKDFYRDFVNLINSVDSDYILFGTDDVVFFDSIDIDVVNKVFREAKNNIFGFMLKLGIEYAKEGSDRIEEIHVNKKKLYRVNWKKSKQPNLKYPFELDSTIYKTELVKMIVNKTAQKYPVLEKMFLRDTLLAKILKKFFSMKNFLSSLETFVNPNTLETLCYRWCKYHKSKLPDYIYFQKICATALQINTVNVHANENNIIASADGEDIEKLNQMYKKGYRVDIEYVSQKKPIYAICESDFFRLVLPENRTTNI